LVTGTRYRFVQPAEPPHPAGEVVHQEGILGSEFEGAAVFRFGSGEIEI